MCGGQESPSDPRACSPGLYIAEGFPFPCPRAGSLTLAPAKTAAQRHRAPPVYDEPQAAAWRARNDAVGFAVPRQPGGLMGSELSQLLQVGHPAALGPRWNALAPACPCNCRRPVRPTAGPWVTWLDPFEPGTVQCLGRGLGGPLDCSAASVTSRRPASASGPAASNELASGSSVLGGHALWQPLAALLDAIQPDRAQGGTALVDCGLFSGLASLGAGRCPGRWLRVTHPFALRIRSDSASSTRWQTAQNTICAP